MVDLGGNLTTTTTSTGLAARLARLFNPAHGENAGPNPAAFIVFNFRELIELIA